VRSILIVRAGAVGDAVLTLPLLETFVGAEPARIGVLGAPSSWAFLAPGRIELLDIAGREWLGLFADGTSLAPNAQAAARGFDTAIVLLGKERERVERALRTLGIAALAAATPATKDEVASESAPVENLTEWHWPPGPAHAASRLLCSLRHLEGGDTQSAWPATQRTLEESPHLRIERAEVERVFHDLDLAPISPPGILAIHPGSGGAAKRWPAVRFVELALAAEKRCGGAPIFIAGAADAEVWRQVRTALPRGYRPRVLLDRPIREVLALLSLARAYVGNDSGITHLAARACPTLALFGPTDPAVWHPVGRRVATLRASRGRLENLPLETVLEGLSRLLD